MAKSDKELIGRNIKLLRNAAGLSQHDLSTLINISKRTIANIESGKTRHSLDVLDEILSFFNFRLEELRSSDIVIPVAFREHLIAYHTKKKTLSTLLTKSPTIVYAIEYKLLEGDFLNTAKEIGQIKLFFEKLGWYYSGPSISNALSRMTNSIQVRKHEFKKNTNVYLKK